jgi:hypothetical protein
MKEYGSIPQKVNALLQSLRMKRPDPSKVTLGDLVEKSTFETKEKKRGKKNK